MIITLPARFLNICPSSLLESGPCPVRGCKLNQLCETYNELPDGCKIHGCNKVHEYRTCIEEIDGFGCRWFSRLSGGRGSGTSGRVIWTGERIRGTVGRRSGRLGRHLLN